MKIARRTIQGSPYLGVFCCVSEKAGLFPLGTSQKEEKELADFFGIEIIKAKIAESSLLGVFAAGNSKGFVLSEIAREKEIQHLKSIGLRIKKLSGITAIGNLLEANDSKGICADTIKPKARNEISDFLKIDLKQAKIAGSCLIGSSLVATNKGFAMNINANEKEFKEAKKFFGFEGSLSTANYGDAFVGNCIVANSNAALVGLHTSGAEIARIDEGLSSE